MRGLGELDELYEEIILDHYRNPRNNEELDNPDAEIEANNPFCGDEVKIQLRFQDGRIRRNRCHRPRMRHQQVVSLATV